MKTGRQPVLIRSTSLCLVFFCVLCLTLVYAAQYAQAAGPLTFAVSSIAAAQTPDGDDDDDNDTGDDDDDNDDTGPCPAAALLGDDDLRLDDLRQFRDNVLAKSALGTKVIALYYASADETVALFEASPELRSAALASLTAVLPALRACSTDQRLTVSVGSVAAAQTPDGDDDDDTGDDDDDDDDNDDTGPCPAAALLGDDDPRLDALRQFRDDVLAKSPAGRTVIAFYYASADEAVALLENNPALKAAAANALEAVLPVIASLDR